MTNSDIVPNPIRGDTFKRRLFAKPQTGTLAGCTIKFTIKKKWSDPGFVLQATTTNGKIVILDATTGLIEVTFSKAEMSTLLGDTDYVYDVEVTDGSGVAFSKPRVTFHVDGDVS